MPSPYDLRSGPVLLQTMNYLITNIMDKFDQEREQGDWYNFLWDRLRAIRKVVGKIFIFINGFSFVIRIGNNSTTLT